MFLFVATINLLPAALVIASYFVAPIETFPVFILLLKIHSNRVDSNDISRIEHKLDCLFSSSEKTSDTLECYKRIHNTAWDHEGPMRPDTDAVKTGKQRNDILIAVDLFNGAVFYFFTSVWFYGLFTGNIPLNF